jgi:hypothetical protein
MEDIISTVRARAMIVIACAFACGIGTSAAALAPFFGA